MIIILDTNIFRQDFLLRSAKVDLLLDYAKKTRARIILPDIVYQELRGLYRRELQRHYNQLEKTRRTLQELCVDHKFEPVVFDLEAQIQLYLKHLKSRLNIRDKDIIPYKNDYLPDIVRRATERIHPFTDDRKEFRDVLVWLTALDAAAATPDHAFALVSGNTKDFASGEDNILHPLLSKEAESRAVNAQYFASLDLFLKSRATLVEFITSEWINNNVDISALEAELQRQLKRHGESLFERYIRRHKEDDAHEPVLTGLQNFDLVDFYCLEMSDGSIRIQAYFESECEVEYSVYEDEEEEYSDYDYDFRPMKGDYGWDYVTKTRIVPIEKTRYAYPVIETQVDIDVKDKAVQAADVIEWYLQ